MCGQTSIDRQNRNLLRKPGAWGRTAVLVGKCCQVPSHGPIGDSQERPSDGPEKDSRTYRKALHRAGCLQEPKQAGKGEMIASRGARQVTGSSAGQR
jgi:hypothetical protein